MVLFYIEKVHLDEFLVRSLKARLTYHVVRHGLWVYLTDNVQRKRNGMLDPIPIDAEQWRRISSALDCRNESFTDEKHLAFQEVLYELDALPSLTQTVQSEKLEDLATDQKEKEETMNKIKEYKKITKYEE